MKKRIILIALILWTIIAVIAAAVMSYAAKGEFILMINNDSLLKTEEISINRIKNIVLEGTSESVEIRTTKSDSLRISQYGDPKTEEDRLFQISTTDDGVRIYFNKVNQMRLLSFGFDIRMKKLVIEIPENYRGNVDLETSSGSLRLKDRVSWDQTLLQSSSGSIRIEKGLTAETFIAETSSGSIHADENLFITKSIKVDSLSGSISIDTVSANDLTAETSSGGIRLGDVKVESYNIRSSSGSIKVQSISGKGEMKSSSGSIRTFLLNPKDQIRLTSSSGSVHLEVEPSLSFSLKAETSSGGIHTNFALEQNDKKNKATATVGNNPAVQITINTTSGSIRVEH